MKSRIGVDISKAKFDAALLLEGNKYRCKVFGNDAAGFAALLGWVESNVPGGTAGVHVCMEATGIHHEALALFLHDRGIELSVVNPMLVKRFAQSEGARSKTDSADAKVLARYADRTRPQLWQAPSHALRRLQALVARLQTLQEMRQTESNRLKVAHEAVRASLLEVIAQLEASIQEVRTRIRQTIDDDPDLRSRRDLLQTIPGLGDKTIPQLLAYIGRPERFRRCEGIDCLRRPCARDRAVGQLAQQEPRHAPAGPPGAAPGAVRPGHGGRQAQPGGRPLLATPGGAEQAGQGDRGGLHAQAAGHRLRRAQVRQTVRSQPLKTHCCLTPTMVS